MSPPDHPAAAVLAIGLVALPLLLLTAGVLAIAIISSCSSMRDRRKHNRRVIHDLTEYARVLRGPK